MRHAFPAPRPDPALTTRIIGLGSPLPGDDVGWRVVERLQDRVGQAVEAIALDRPGPSLINWFEGMQRIILIDGVIDDRAPGRLLRLSPEDCRPSADIPTTHSLDLQQTIGLARALDCLPASIEIHAVTVARSYEDQRVTQAIDRLAADLIERFSQVGQAAGAED